MKGFSQERELGLLPGVLMGAIYTFCAAPMPAHVDGGIVARRPSIAGVGAPPAIAISLSVAAQAGFGQSPKAAPVAGAKTISA
jgi:hypothetical protein